MTCAIILVKKMTVDAQLSAFEYENIRLQELMSFYANNTNLVAVERDELLRLCNTPCSEFIPRINYGN